MDIKYDFTNLKNILEHVFFCIKSNFEINFFYNFAIMDFNYIVSKQK
jgi:hypothetical protein